ncbi:energy-coupling factor transporter transmembrane component T, partial [Azospirillum sp.]|uniref:energy-coupling factor transporter transmembrane component T n=1 Tax=Azospirillum sp. TaxID=34012 RepID=UPI002D26E7DD
ATLVTLTTRVSDMVETLERALAWLRPLGVNAGKVSLMLALTIRLVPVLLAQAQEIRMAQRARGVERSAVALLVPLMVKTLRMADDLADALEARGYDPH